MKYSVRRINYSEERAPMAGIILTSATREFIPADSQSDAGSCPILRVADDVRSSYCIRKERSEVIGCVSLDLTLRMEAGVVNFRGVECLIINDEVDDLLIGKPELFKLRIDPEMILEQR